jgi:hypothetical protein
VIVLPAENVPGELEAEFAAWERAGDEAWALIDPWEEPNHESAGEAQG